MVQKMAKKFTGVPQKIPKNPKKMAKMAKNGPTEPHVIALKRVTRSLRTLELATRGSLPPG